MNSAGEILKPLKGTNLPTLTGITQSGLYLDGSKMGYHDGTEWKSYMASDGTFKFKGNDGNEITWDGTSLDIEGRLINVTNSTILMTGLKIDTQTSKTSYTVTPTETINLYVWSTSLNIWDLSQSYGNATQTSSDYDTAHSITSKVDKGLRVATLPNDSTGGSGAVPPVVTGVYSQVFNPSNGTPFNTSSSRDYTCGVYGADNNGGCGIKAYSYSPSGLGYGIIASGAERAIDCKSTGTVIQVQAQGSNAIGMMLSPYTLGTVIHSINNLPTWSGDLQGWQTVAGGYYTGFLNTDKGGQLWLHDDTQWNLIPSMKQVPTTSTDTGKQGQMSVDNNYLYLANQDNTWKKSKLVDFDLDTSWQSVGTWLNSWDEQDSGGTTGFRYKIDELGNVHLMGSLLSVSATSSIAFVLPTGYRPAIPEVYGVYFNPSRSNDSESAIRIRDNGNVEVLNYSGSAVIYVNIVFSTQGNFL